MNSQKRKALELAGWRFGDAADFLEMTEEERQLLDARLEVALAVRRQREAARLSQKQLASRIRTSQPRVAKIERAARDVSLDQILRAFTAAGGRIAVRQDGGSRSRKAVAPGVGVGMQKPARAAKVQAVKVEIQLQGKRRARDSA